MILLDYISSLPIIKERILVIILVLFFFFFIDTAPPEIYTLSLHVALPISNELSRCGVRSTRVGALAERESRLRSEEHTSELQSRPHLVCRLLLEKKKK